MGPFRHEAGSNRVGLIIETPSMKALEAALATEEAADAVKQDGVRPDTVTILVEA